MLKLIKTEIYDGAIAGTNPDCVHDIKVAHALVDALEEWHSLHPYEETYFDILEAADNILREKYGVTE